MFRLTNFLKDHRYLYHMAAVDSWPQIKRHGLLCTNDLLDRCKVPSEERHLLSNRRRNGSVSIAHPDFGSAVIRDQRVLPVDRLKSLLHPDTTLERWYELLNERVFLWAAEKSLNGLINARSYRNQAQLVLTFNSQAVFSAYANRIELTDINTGAVMFPNSPERGQSTFQTPQAFRPKPGRKLVEVTVLGGIRNVDNLLVSVDVQQPNSGPRTTLWQAN